MYGMVIPQANRMYPRLCTCKSMQLTREADSQLTSIPHPEFAKTGEVSYFINNSLCLNTKKKSNVTLSC